MSSLNVFDNWEDEEVVPYCPPPPILPKGQRFAPWPKEDTHALAADLFQRVRDAPTTKELETIIYEAFSFWTSDRLQQGTLEAVAYRSARRSTELWKEAGCPTARPKAAVKDAPEAIGDEIDMELFARQREAFRVEKARRGAGMSRHSSTRNWNK